VQVTSLKFKEQAGHKSVEIILFPDCYPRVSIDALAEEQEENLVGRMHSSIHHSSPSQPHTHTHTQVENLPQEPFRINHNHAEKPHTTATGCGESQYLLFCKSPTKSCTLVG